MGKNKPEVRKKDKVVNLIETDEHEPGSAPTVLVVDDQARIRRAFSKRLEQHGFDSIQADSGVEALDQLEEYDVELVLLDIEMPEVDGYEVLETLRADYKQCQLPVIMLTGRKDENDVLKGLQSGANDYVTKRTDFEIVLARIKTQLQLKNARDQIVELSRTDELTGLLNRRAFYESLTNEQERFQRTNDPYSLILLDIDHFKEINDTYGHDAGDRVLQEFSDRLRDFVRKVDVLGRYGGEEFILLLPRTEFDGARTLAENLRKIITGEAFPVGDGGVKVTASFGVATQKPEDPLTYEELIQLTDEALYEAKQDGRNCVRSNKIFSCPKSA